MVAEDPITANSEIYPTTLKDSPAPEDHAMQGNDAPLNRNSILDHSDHAHEIVERAVPIPKPTANPKKVPATSKKSPTQAEGKKPEAPPCGPPGADDWHTDDEGPRSIPTKSVQVKGKGKASVDSIHPDRRRVMNTPAHKDKPQRKHREQGTRAASGSNAKPLSQKPSPNP